MLILLSPSKTIDTATKVSCKKYTQPFSIADSNSLVRILKTYSTNELSNLMSISPKLSQLNYDRFQHWNASHNISNSKQAILSFKGEVFTGLDAVSFSEDELKYTQNHLVILSGLYGMLRPLDLIQPYRLEISTKLSLKNNNNLYTFWRDKVTENLNRIINTQNNPTIINLASNEYFKVINKKNLQAKIITPIFKEFKDNNYKVVTIYAKKARGLMTNYILKKKIDKIDDIKFFDKEGYYFNEALSDDKQFVFTR